MSSAVLASFLWTSVDASWRCISSGTALSVNKPVDTALWRNIRVDDATQSCGSHTCICAIARVLLEVNSKVATATTGKVVSSLENMESMSSQIHSTNVSPIGLTLGGNY